MLTLAVPVYNMASYLPRCMDALLNQTCPDYEILLIDDGSTDGSESLCDRYAQEHPDRVRVIHKENGGLSSARNTGIACARGNWITFPDPDDWVESDYTAQFLSLGREHHADLVCTGYCVDTDSGTTPAKPDSQFRIFTGSDARRALLLPPQLDGFAWNKCFRLDIIRENGLNYLDDVGITEDLDFAFRYLSFCQTVCHAPQARTYHYYQRDGAATRSGFSLRKLDTLHTYEKIIAACAASDPELALAAEDELCTAAVNLIRMYENSDRSHPQARAVLLGKIRKHLPAHLKSAKYGAGRKLQALLAGFSPKLYCLVKNVLQK